MERFMGLWRGILYHVTGRHEWAFGRCLHEQLNDEDREKEWIQKDSPAYMALIGVVLNKKWLKDVPKFLNFRYRRCTCPESTVYVDTWNRTISDLETFHNHILMYAGKRFAFSSAVYEARTLLAALDYNHHNTRPPMLTKEGNRVYQKIYNKKSSRSSLYTIKSHKSYSYIPDLQRAITRRRLMSGKGVPRKRTSREEDTGRFGLLPPVEPPTTEELLQSQVSRGKILL
ncbi:uncharacterized protein LOC125886583 [Epinephelus fuscoguttatus]|uniref:uncharacterized protein LOC125886583 n=1 Tax=Epinephelus fuscoguttatus TaxID=293821 RepID=UPI0020D159AE|nr:uncharacterized protein LOC125886583 [Epinephelus fuscoguttatus]